MGYWPSLPQYERIPGDSERGGFGETTDCEIGNGEELIYTTILDLTNYCFPWELQIWDSVDADKNIADHSYHEQQRSQQLKK